MAKKIELLDCTLRDGAYVVDSKFGPAAIKSLVCKLQAAGIDIIECGWLKNQPHEKGSVFYHVPGDFAQYITEKSAGSLYVAMIDWDRYDLNNLTACDGKTIDAVRIVFPHGKQKEGIRTGSFVREKGYQVFYQAANTLAYTDHELMALAEDVNKSHPICLSIVDTFGAMYETDLERIVSVLDSHLDRNIKLGFHSHNNQQLSFALAVRFVELLKDSERGAVVDASLCGMGRGAGNANTELAAGYLNRKNYGSYDMDVILNAIDQDMEYFRKNYAWGYSAPYFIAGRYCCHVNNISYLIQEHRTCAEDLNHIIASLKPDERLRYDYSLLEKKYQEHMLQKEKDKAASSFLKKTLNFSGGESCM